MMRLLNIDTILGAVLLVIGSVLLVSSYQQNAAVFVLPGDAPPFLVPQLFLYFWMGLSLVMCAGGIARGGTAFEPQNWPAIVAAAAVIILATALMRPLGYLAVAPIAVFVVCLLLGYRRHLVSALVSIGVVGVLYGLLVGLARLPLPTVPGLDL